MSPSEHIHLLPEKNKDNLCNTNGDDKSCVCSLPRHKSITSTHEHANSPNNNNDWTTKKNSWSVILFGQTIALALSCANAASSTLENNYQIMVPTFQTGLVYFILSFHLMYLFWILEASNKTERRKWHQLWNDWGWYSKPSSWTVRWYAATIYYIFSCVVLRWSNKKDITTTSTYISFHNHSPPYAVAHLPPPVHTGRGSQLTRHAFIPTHFLIIFHASQLAISIVHGRTAPIDIPKCKLWMGATIRNFHVSHCRVFMAPRRILQ